MQCKFCYSSVNKDEEISISRVNEILTFLLSADIKKVILSGGEPTINKNFFRILEILSSSGVEISIVTNGLKFSNKHFLHQSICSGLNGIIFSIKGFTPTDYEKIAGGNFYPLIIKAIENLRNLNVKTTYQFTFSSETINNISDFIAFVTLTKIDNLITQVSQQKLGIKALIYAGWAANQCLT